MYESRHSKKLSVWGNSLCAGFVFRVIIYHGHLHKIPIDDEIKEIQENELITTEE